MLFEHALRCFCKLCGSLLDWDCPADISYTETECCGLRYRLQPWTVKVHIEDVSSRPVLPAMDGSAYADPDLDLTEQLIGNVNMETTRAKSLTQAQLDLRPPAPVTESMSRKCGICRQPGHTKRHCPKA